MMSKKKTGGQKMGYDTIVFGNLYIHKWINSKACIQFWMMILKLV